MFKKKLKVIISMVLICIMMCTLIACSKTLNGTYTSDDGLIEQSFKFNKDNTVEVSAFGINIEGEYSIEGEEITITYSAFGLSYDWVKSFEKKGDTIFIDGVKFVKEK